jgi:hypothetical protein
VYEITWLIILRCFLDGELKTPSSLYQLPCVQLLTTLSFEKAYFLYLAKKISWQAHSLLHKATILQQREFFTEPQTIHACSKNIFNWQLFGIIITKCVLIRTLNSVKPCKKDYLAPNARFLKAILIFCSIVKSIKIVYGSNLFHQENAYLLRNYKYPREICISVGIFNKV